MKKSISLIVLLMFIALQGFSWGKTGHRIVGQIAENHLSDKAKKNLKLLMGNETLASVSNFMDFIKSEPKYKHMDPWHYSTIPDSLTYEQAGTPPEGDVIVTIQRLIEELKTKKFTDEDELFALKCLVHLIGDIHQPLHVGNGFDKGANDINVRFFYENRNLHSVWDSGIIDHEQLSFTEYTKEIDHATPQLIAKLQASTVLDWANESKAIRPQLYTTMANDNRLSYRYIYDNKHIVDRRLMEAGIRLAGVLNAIYG